jgi:hypothetical protein
MEALSMKHSGWLAVSKRNRATVFLTGIQTREQAEELIAKVYGLDAYRAEWTDAWDDQGDRNPMCDFCSTRPVVRRLKMPNIMSDTLWTKPGEKDFRMLHEMLGDWFACQSCWALIGENRWRDLSQNSARSYVENNDVPEGKKERVYLAVLGQVLPLHEEVRRLWLGKSEPVNEEGGES